jgi:hypothetical protein
MVPVAARIVPFLGRAATLDSSTAPIEMRCAPRVRWRQSQGSVGRWALLVVNENTKHIAETATVQDQ